MRVLGLMSGTSADGIDAVLVDLHGSTKQPQWKLLKSSFTPYPNKLKNLILDVGEGLKLSSLEWLELSESLTEIYYCVVNKCDPNDIARVIGCHGQTVWHRPPFKDKLGASLQLIQAPLLAQLLKKTSAK